MYQLSLKEQLYKCRTEAKITSIDNLNLFCLQRNCVYLITDTYTSLKTYKEVVITFEKKVELRCWFIGSFAQSFVRLENTYLYQYCDQMALKFSF